MIRSFDAPGAATTPIDDDSGLTALANATTNCFPMILISGSSEREVVAEEVRVPGRVGQRLAEEGGARGGIDSLESREIGGRRGLRRSPRRSRRR